MRYDKITPSTGEQVDTPSICSPPGIENGNTAACPDSRIFPVRGFSPWGKADSITTTPRLSPQRSSPELNSMLDDMLNVVVSLLVRHILAEQIAAPPQDEDR